jgi:hypothetical protein
MKKPLYVILGLAVWAVAPAFSQDQVQTPAVRSTASMQQEKTLPAQTTAATLTKFDLDFPGGSPNELVAAIQKATGHPLNAIVPIAYASLKLPPLKMKGVDVAQLFKALELASSSNRLILDGNSNIYNQATFGFRTEGAVSDDSVWYFFISSQQYQPPKVSRIYLLTPYLDRGLTVDDITTAIQTGWKMLGASPTPVLSFHKETKLLIAVGDPNQLQTIDQVLGALSAPTAATKAKPEPDKTKL